MLQLQEGLGIESVSQLVNCSVAHRDLIKVNVTYGNDPFDVGTTGMCQTPEMGRVKAV